MQTSILFKAQGMPSSRPIVIFNGSSIGAKSSTSAFVRLSRALWSACKSAVCKCTPTTIYRAVFSPVVSTAVVVLVVVAMYWHAISIADAAASQAAVSADCLVAMPWAIVWAARLIVADYKKGGAL